MTKKWTWEMIADTLIKEFQNDKYAKGEKMPSENKMAVRFRAYQAGEGSFPHEMGIFLGYPLEDVKGFIEHEGKDYLYQGYWKVYGDVEKCEKMFSVYNRVKAQVVEEIEKGKALWQAAVSIRVPA